jgi:hypothetical protein
MASASEFARQLDAWIFTEEGRAADRIKRFVIRFWEEVAQRTPVDTGAAKDSWNVAVGAANPDWKDRRTGYSNPLGVPAGTVQLGSFKLGDEIHVSNNAPYIGALNNGHSRQAPAAFVEQTFAAVEAEIFGL